jgi:uncharacterized Zn-finger protein
VVEEVLDEEQDYDEEEIITLNPNKLYESSDESEDESEHIVAPISTIQHPTPQHVQIRVPPVPPQLIGNEDFKREIYHCRYCDVVFIDFNECSAHEERNHDPQSPFECVICQFKTDTHHTLIGHIKFAHSPDKPHVCSQCKKFFIRRADLRKHTFVHAGIRLYSCEICKKSFTHKTNLNKHKRTHSSTEPPKTYKCTLCPRAFTNNSDLSSHLEIHMERSAIVCKHCNQAFLEREELDLHIKSHFENQNQQQMEIQSQQQIQMIQKPSIGFYNQIMQEPTSLIQVSSQHQQPSMNFYTENTQRHNFPIINQLLSGIQPEIQIKKFVCGICNSTFNKKKEHDRHVTTIHTNLRQFHCEKCPKTFNRKDKLLQHERTHVMPTIFNCSLCPAVFVRQQMLDIHMKAHQFPNGESTSTHIEHFLGALQSIPTQANLLNQHNENGVAEMPKGQPAQIICDNNIDFSYPMNLSTNKIDEKISPKISNEKITIESDDDDDDDSLRIVEEPIKKRIKILPELKPITPELIKNHNEKIISEEDISLKIADMTDKIEPLQDLPMEILNND